MRPITPLDVDYSRLPVVAIVGRPNVGKSTLFNALTRTRAALVADEPGVTRDRQHGIARVGSQRVVLVDTAGLSDEADVLTTAIVRQAERAVDEADVVILLVDYREGPNAEDTRIAEFLRRSGRPTLLTVNKCEGIAPDLAGAEFHALGLSPVRAISAAHRQGLRPLMDAAIGALPTGLLDALDGAEAPPTENLADNPDRPVAVAILGRPNVGKSTLVNRLTGAQHMVAHDLPGTTRDSVRIPFQRGDQRYSLIDTAGVRRRSRVDQGIEKLSVIKSLQAIEASDVVVLVLDAEDGVADQDAILLGHVLNAGRALVVAANKWDRLRPPERRQLTENVDRKLGFAGFASVHSISALHGTGLGKLFESIDRAWQAARIDVPTSALTRLLEDAVSTNPPPLARGRQIKLRYAHQGGRAPPVVVIHGNQTDAMPTHYKRYLANFFRERLGLHGTPLRIELRSGENPFKGQKNKLTGRQEKKRKRLRTFSKARK